MNAEKQPLNDPALPQLNQVVDGGRMAQEFDHQLFQTEKLDGNHSRFNVRGCRIGRIKYKRGFRCTIGYHLSIEDQQTGNTHEQLLSARIYKPGESGSHFERAARKPMVTPKFGPPMFHVDALSMIVWAFPNDRKLLGLSSITNPELLKKDLLPPVVMKRWGADWSIETIQHSIASYIPEGRCCVRFELFLRNSTNGEARTWTIFGKAHCSDRGERGHLTLQRLWDCHPEVGIPRPLAYQPEYRMFWQEAVNGHPLANQSIDKATLLMTAKAVANLHCTAYTGEFKIRMSDVARSLGEIDTKLGDALKSGRDQLSAVVKRMLDQVETFDSAVEATIHRDLHPHNILIHQNRANLIDLDDVCIGPPLLDLGSFIARILYQALLDDSPSSTTRTIIDGFIQHYRREVPWPVRVGEIAWYTAAALINERVFRRLTHLDVEHPAILEQVIQLADELSRGEGTAMEFAEND